MSDGVARCRVLVVEDEPLVGMEIEDAVEELGHEIVGPIAELQEALDLAVDEAIGCAILDINIRGGRSYPVAEILMERGVPVLLLSGYREQALPERLQGEVLLSKPFTIEQLDTAIRNLCARALKSGFAAAPDKLAVVGTTDHCPG